MEVIGRVRGPEDYRSIMVMVFVIVRLGQSSHRRRKIYHSNSCKM